MNTAWLNGKCPVLDGVSTPPKVLDKWQPSENSNDTDWSGWVLFWFISLSLCCVVNWNLLDLALFVALVKWLSTDRAKDQNQTDRLFHRLTKEDSSTFNYDNDWIHNPIYSAYIGNVFHIADPWDDPAHGHLHDDYCQHDHWH